MKNNSKPSFAAVLVILVLSMAPAFAAEQYVDGDLSGNWYDPANSGHGFQVEVLNLSRAVVAWYAFEPDGDPLWLFGVGGIQGDTIEVELFRYSGTGFPPDFDPAEINQERWGEVTFRQTGCDTAVVSFQPDDPEYVPGEIALERLTRIDGSRCGRAGDFDQTVTWNLDAGARGFEALFLDYPDGEEDFYELDSGQRALTGAWAQRSGFLISGNNHSDDLMMVVMRPLDGLEPGARYNVELEMQFATNVPSGCVGVGGSPGESVYMRLGASTGKPGFEIADDGHRRATLDLGQQAQPGADALSVGDMANALSDAWCGMTDRPWQFKRVSTAGQGFEVTADDNGRIWVYGLSDSAFEATTTWYLTELTVHLDRADGAPSIAKVLDCGRLGPTGGVGARRDLQRLDLDPGAFPEAVCNDGTQGFLWKTGS